MSLESAAALVAANEARAPRGSRWRHLESGDIYILHGHGLIEADLTPAVYYLSMDPAPGGIRCRPASEFFDGRFVRMDRARAIGQGLRAVEGAEFLGANRNGRLDDDLFEMYSGR